MAKPRPVIVQVLSKKVAWQEINRFITTQFRHTGTDENGVLYEFYTNHVTRLDGTRPRETRGYKYKKLDKKEETDATETE